MYIFVTLEIVRQEKNSKYCVSLTNKQNLFLHKKASINDDS